MRRQKPEASVSSTRVNGETTIHHPDNGAPRTVGIVHPRVETIAQALQQCVEMSMITPETKIMLLTLQERGGWHNTNHLNRMVKFVTNNHAHRLNAHELRRLWLMIGFHDLVYVPGRLDNEALSANAFRKVVTSPDDRDIRAIQNTAFHPINRVYNDRSLASILNQADVEVLFSNDSSAWSVYRNSIVNDVVIPITVSREQFAWRFFRDIEGKSDYALQQQFGPELCGTGEHRLSALRTRLNEYKVLALRA